MTDNLPNLVVIGAMKCGTTSLHDYLAMHPDVFMSNPKEVNYFSGDNSHRSLEWYKALFPTNHKIRGESSQNYSKAHSSFYKDSPKNMFDIIPNAKLIYLVRDPIERYRSHILENYYGESPKDIEWNVANNSYVMTGMYYYQLSSFLKYYALENIKIVVLEELKINRLKVMNEIFEFLGIPTMQDSKEFDYISNDHKDKGIPYKIRISLWYRVLYKFFPKTALNIGASNVIKNRVYPDIKKIDLDDKQRLELLEQFKEDTNKFRKLVGLKLTQWSV